MSTDTQIRPGQTSGPYDPDQPDQGSATRQHDIAMLEKIAATPYMGKNTDAPKKIESDELSSREKQGNQHEKSMSSAEGSFYTAASADASKSRLIKIKRRKRIAMGGGLSGIFIGILISALGYSSGPFEFIQFAQELTQFHFSQQSSADDSRLMRLVRYARSPHLPQNTRMGWLGNKYADGIEARFNEHGIRSSYTPIAGYADGYFIDAEQYRKTHPELKLKTNDDVKNHLKTEYGLDAESKVGSRKLAVGEYFIGEGKMSFWGTRSLIRTMVKESKLTNLAAAIASRMMAIRSSVDLHPLRPLKNVAGKKAEQIILKNRDTEIEKGATALETETTTSPDKSTGGTSENAATLDEQLTQIGEEGKSASTAAAAGTAPTEEVTALKSKLGKTTLKAVGIAAVFCILQSVEANVEQINFQQIQLPEERLAMNIIAIGSQLKNGSPDISMTALSAVHQFMSDIRGDWTGSKSIQAERGVTPSANSYDIPESARGGTNNDFLPTVLGSIPGLGTICKGLESAPGQFLQISMTLLGGPLDIALGAAQAVILPFAIDFAAHMLASRPVPSDVSGPDLGSVANYGARHAANDVAITQGGVALTDAQSAELNQAEQTIARQDFQSKSLAYRLFDRSDSRSLLAGILQRSGTNARVDITKVAGIFTNFTHTLAVLPQNLFGKASADAPYRYSFAKYGFTQEDLNDPRFKNPYDNATIVANTILPGPDGQTYIDRAKSCFGMIIGLDGTAVSSGTAPRYDQMGPSCTSRSEDWLRVRLYILDTTTMSGISCYFGDDQACHDTGF